VEYYLDKYLSDRQDVLVGQTYKDVYEDIGIILWNPLISHITKYKTRRTLHGAFIYGMTQEVSRELYNGY
jgi:hypothetical protein